MDLELIFKALANPLRFQIFAWLKEPDRHFSEMIHLPEEDKGKGYVCVSAIREKAGITQSTTSHYLNQLRQAGLLSSKRIGQWTYYRRDEKVIEQVSEFISKGL